MDAQIALALIASFTSLAVAVAGIPLNYLLGKRVRREQGLDMMSYYRDRCFRPQPISVAVLSLSWRRISCRGFLLMGRNHKSFTHEPTLCLFSQNFCVGLRSCAKGSASSILAMMLETED